MNTQNKIPMWPLYAADAAMFLTALLIALPNAVSGQRMELDQTALCVFMVLAAMLMLASPYIFDTIAGKKSAAEFEKATSQKFAAAAEAFEGIDRKFSEYTANFAAIKDSLEKIVGKMGENKAAVKNISDEFETAKLGIEYLKGELARLAKKFDELEMKDAQNQEENSEFSEELDEIKTRLDSAEGTAKAAERLAARLGDLESANLTARISETDAKLEGLSKQIKELENSLEKYPPDETDGDLEDISLMDKALKSGAETAFAGSRMGAIISAAKPKSKAPEEECAENANPDGNFSQDAPAISEIEPEESVEEPFQTPQELEEQILDSSPEDEFEESGEDESAQEDAEISGDADNSVGIQLPTEESAATPTPVNPESPSLFDIESSPGKPKAAKKGQTSIIANALIGIGNKPFLRGNGGGLNPDRGVAMDFVEIGKWQWVCKEEISEPLDVKIFVNDEFKIDNSSFTIAPNQKLEVNLIYSK